jgi:hypothetical protein
MLVKIGFRTEHRLRDPENLPNGVADRCRHPERLGFVQAQFHILESQGR